MVRPFRHLKLRKKFSDPTGKLAEKYAARKQRMAEKAHEKKIGGIPYSVFGENEVHFFFGGKNVVKPIRKVGGLTITDAPTGAIVIVDGMKLRVPEEREIPRIKLP